MSNRNKPFSVSVYEGISNVGRGISHIYNEAVGANALERNGAALDGPFDFGFYNSATEDLGIMSRHMGFALGAGIAAFSMGNPIALGIAASVYATMTVLPTMYRIGRVKKENYEEEQRMAQLAEERRLSEVGEAHPNSGLKGASRIRRFNM